MLKDILQRSWGRLLFPEGKSRLEKNSSEFFDLREGVTLITGRRIVPDYRKNWDFYKAKKRYL
jgi:hypothetical protein